MDKKESSIISLNLDLEKIDENVLSEIIFDAEEIIRLKQADVGEKLLLELERTDAIMQGVISVGEIIKLKILGTLERHMASIYTRYVISGEIERARGIRRAMMNREKKKKKMKRLRRRR